MIEINLWDIILFSIAIALGYMGAAWVRWEEKRTGQFKRWRRKFKLRSVIYP